MVRRDLDPRPLVLLATVVTLLGAVGVVPVWSGTAHHVALPPLDLFADVRVLLAESPSYPVFIAGLLVVLGVRAIVLAATLRALNRGGLVRAVRFYGVALLPALVSGGLAFSGVAAVYSPFLWAGVAIAVLAVLVMGPRPWRRAAARHGPAKALVYFAALLGVSLLSTLGGAAARLGHVWVSAVLTAAAALWLGGGRSGTRPARALPAAGAPVLAVVVTLVAIAASSTASPRAGSQADGTLLVVPGIGGSSGTSTMFRVDPSRLGYSCDTIVYFSYAGPGTGAPQREARCPILSGAPYRPDDTLRPLDELVRSFRAQYEGLVHPVVVIAHSQGGWVAAAALSGEAGVARQDTLVLLGAFPGHRTAYRPDHGAGVVGTDLLEALTAALRGLRGTTFDPRAPLPSELLGTRGAVNDVVRDAVGAGVRVITVTSAFDLPIMASDADLPRAVDLCPVYVHHGNLPRSPKVLADVRRALGSPTDGGCGWWRRWPTQAFAAFAVPTP